MWEGTLMSSQERAHRLYLEGHLHGRQMILETHAGSLTFHSGLSVLSVLFSSLGLCRYKSWLYLVCVTEHCLYLPRSLERFTPCFFYCHLVDNRILRTGETGSDFKTQDTKSSQKLAKAFLEVLDGGRVQVAKGLLIFQNRGEICSPLSQERCVFALSLSEKACKAISPSEAQPPQHLNIGTTTILA